MVEMLVPGAVKAVWAGLHQAQGCCELSVQCVQVLKAFSPLPAGVGEGVGALNHCV